MGELMFFVKSLVITFVIVLVLQIKIGESTVEKKISSTIRSSSVGEYLTEVAQGGVNVASKFYKKLVGSIDTGVSKNFNFDNVPGKRELVGGFERSQKYIAEKRAKAEAIEKKGKEVAIEYERAAEDVSTATQSLKDEVFED
jgi:hypothetical protein